MIDNNGGGQQRHAKLATGYDGEGQEWAARDGGDSRVVMMTAAEEVGSSGQQRQRRMTMMANDDDMQDWAADYGGEGQERWQTMALDKAYETSR